MVTKRGIAVKTGFVTILMVEDDPNDQFLIKETLRGVR